MSHDQRCAHSIYDTVIALLAEEEVASANKPEAAGPLSAADEYLDLEQLEQGVQHGPVSPTPLYRVLPRKAVREATWANILGCLGAMKRRTA